LRNCSRNKEERSENSLSSKISELNLALRNLEQNCNLVGTALVSDKGQMICSSLPEEAEEKAVAAMAAAMLSIGTRVGSELETGRLRSTLIDGEAKSILLREIGRILLIGIAPSQSEIGLIDFEFGKAAEKIDVIIRR
jgi:predicted regulator of Ras-like GTPase activity (Roadblock/LC7/MglB family)